MTPDWISTGLAALEAAHARRTLRPLEGPTGPRVRVAGREIRCFSSNDYLGLAADPRLAEAAARAARRWGSGSGASRLITGTLGLHEELEAALARLKGAESALVFGTGYQANLALITALGEEGTIFSDEWNHASIVDGCRLARGHVERYRHGDVADLARALEDHAGASRKLVVTDGVFSMDGDVAPLPEIIVEADARGALVVIDDAHATGVIGGGRGTTHHFGIGGDRVVHMGTLGKALGSFGAFVACPAPVRDWLVNRARSFIYTTAPPPPVLGASLEAVRILEAEPERVERLHGLSRRLRQGLEDAGFRVPHDPTPVVPVVLGDNETTLAWAEDLWRRGFWVHPIRPPTVPEGSARLRITVSAAHEQDDVDTLVVALGELRATVPGSRLPVSGRAATPRAQKTGAVAAKHDTNPTATPPAASPNPEKPGTAIFIAGTDTGVGKTTVATALCRALRGMGFSVGVFKPAETGCPSPHRADDALALVAASNCEAPLDLVCPYRLTEPLAPAVAARRQGVTIDPDHLDRCLAQLRRTHDVVVVEGAGGLLVPLGEGVLTVDWVARAGLPVLLVGRLGLGTINHTLLSARHLSRTGIPLVGTVLSETSFARETPETTNPEVLEGFPEADLLGVLPHGADLPTTVVAQVAMALGLQ